MVCFCKILFTLMTLFYCHVEPSRILFVLPTATYSHLLFARTIYKELVDRGHDVVAFVPFKIRNDRVANLREIAWSYEKTTTSHNDFLKMHSIFLYLRSLKNMIGTCDSIYERPEMRRILRDPRQKFDLVVIEWNVAACYSVLKEHFKAPLIGVRSLGLRLEGHDYIGNPTNPSYLPMGYNSYSADFFGRLNDFVFAVFWRMHHNLYTIPAVQKKVDKYFPDARKSCVEFEKDVDLVLTNTNYIVNGVRPLVPAMVDVGMVHIGKEIFNLTNETSQFLDDSKDGFILFNIGTTLSSDAFTEDVKDSLFDTFGKLPYNVVLKFETNTFKHVPSNVRIWNWLPQETVLGHPRIKCFITHGGLLSMQEAIHYKVPMVVIPFLFDQPFNAYRIERLQIGRRLSIAELADPEILFKIITDVCGNHTYKDNVGRISDTLQDVPMKPLDRAIWWIEYVIRNKGLPYGRSDAVHVNWFSYLLLDVVLYLAICLVIAYKTVECIYKRFICPKKEYIKIKNY